MESAEIYPVSFLTSHSLKTFSDASKNACRLQRTSRMTLVSISTFMFPHSLFSDFLVVIVPRQHTYEGVREKGNSFFVGDQPRHFPTVLQYDHLVALLHHGKLFPEIVLHLGCRCGCHRRSSLPFAKISIYFLQNVNEIRQNLLSLFRFVNDELYKTRNKKRKQLCSMVAKWVLSENSF